MAPQGGKGRQMNGTTSRDGIEFRKMRHEGMFYYCFEVVGGGWGVGSVADF